MKSFLLMVLLFVFPANVVRFLLIIVRSKNFFIGKKVKIGFSLIYVHSLVLKEGAHIGHLNIIKVNEFILEGGSIGRMNIFKGCFDVAMLGGSWILNGNRFTANEEVYQKVKLLLKSNAAIIANHIFDMTDNISIGEGSVVAGVGTQLWTHSFFVTPNVVTGIRVDAPIVIGDFCYIGSRSVLLSGVDIADYVTVGAGSCVSKSLEQKGCYVGQKLRYFPLDVNEKMASLGMPVLHDFIYRKKRSPSGYED